MRRKSIKELLNLNFVDYTNQTYYLGKYDLPYVTCIIGEDLDYLALFSEVKDYHKSDKTGVCFYQYDNVFDGICGLFNAIYYNDVSLLKFYKERFKNVYYFIAPDYSQVGDAPVVECLYRYFKSRVVSLWLTLELDAVVIPNITYGRKESFSDMLVGMDDCNVVAFSLKGSMKDTEQKSLLLDAIKYTVDHLNLESIIVNSVSTNNDKVYELFAYAIEKGIKIIIPNNSLKSRNDIKRLDGGEVNG